VILPWNFERGLVFVDKSVQSETVQGNRAVIIHGSGISFSYDFDGHLSSALTDIGIEIENGEFVAILGQNGSGKSTLAKHFNALLPIQKGELTVCGIDARDESEVWRLRRLCGMVFQNPDNQFVSSIIEEDVAFGLENYEVARNLIPDKVKEALSLVGMSGYEKRSPHSLSGGQKQRVALAGVLALDPDIIVFDEVTAMLDPMGRKEILEEIRRLNSETGKTVVMITHYVEETVNADRVFLLHNGRALGFGTPREIFGDTELMQLVGLIPPVPVRLYNDLKAEGICLKSCPLTNEELVYQLSDIQANLAASFSA